MDLGTLCDFVARLFGGSLSPFLTKCIFVNDPIFFKTLPRVFCPPLPTEPQLINKEPLVLNSELGEVVYRPPQQHNSHIPSPHPRCVSRKIKSVCKLCKSGAVGRVQGQPLRQEWSPRPTPLVPLLPQLQWPSSTSPSSRAKLPEAGLAPQPQQSGGLVTGH